MEEKEFKEFAVEDLFIVEGTKSLDARNLSFLDDGVNFVGRSNDNNGVQGKIALQDFVSNAADTLTATVVGNYKYVKYQLEPYYCSQNINKLTPKFKINPLIGLYMRTHLQLFVSHFDGKQGGYKLRELQTHKLSLPVTPSGSPDFAFMETYIRAIEKLVIADVVEFKNKRLELTKTII